MRLSKDFELHEFTKTDTGLSNTPASREIQALTELVHNVLQPARDRLGMPITVTSGYRSPAVNRAVGGAPRSQHLKGEAADLVCADMRRLFALVRDTLTFDQLIWEGGDHNSPAWIHISYRQHRNRKQVIRVGNL